MSFACYENGKRCNTLGMSGGWNNDCFATIHEAELFCFLWAYPYGIHIAGDSYTPMELSRPINMSMSEHPVMMEIREVDEEPTGYIE
jgi:hypothetical protein